ncbi:5'-3' exonuclease, partial [Deinococcus multiflagellatus]
QTLYPAYKGQRNPKPDDLEALLGQAATLMTQAGAMPAAAPNHEADDVLGTLARRAPGPVVIVTSDRDLLSTVTDQVSVFDPRTRQVMTPADVQRRFGVPPARMTLFKSLCGDASDNIPGVHGLGEKGSAHLAHLYSTVDEVFAHAPSVELRYRKPLLAANRSEIELFFQLVTVRVDAPVVRVR